MAAKNLICHTLKDGRDWREVLMLLRDEVAVDWQGQKLSNPYRFAIGKDSRYLTFVAEVPFEPPVSKPDLKGRFVNDFAEPETRGQTAELFVMGADDRYFEIHITPDGAWWYMNFLAYRKRDARSVPPDAEVWVERRPDSWTGAISLPLAQLGTEISRGIRAQVTLCLCQHEVPRYVTSAGCPDFEADYHDRRAFSFLKFK